MLRQLYELYCDMLRVGFLVLRQGLDAGDLEWLDSELELLHNVPSLVAETNAARHEYFWMQERTRYIEWASSPGREWQRSRMLTYYEPLWREMEPLILAICRGNETGSAGNPKKGEAPII